MSQPSARGKMNGAIKSKPALLVSLVAVLVLLAGSRSFAQGNVADTAAVTEVMQTLAPDQLQVTQPTGLAYSGADDTFVLLDASAAGEGGLGAFTLYAPATNTAVALAGGPAVDVGANMTYDGTRLLLLDGRSGELTAAGVAAARPKRPIRARREKAGSMASSRVVGGGGRLRANRGPAP